MMKNFSYWVRVSHRDFDVLNLKNSKKNGDSNSREAVQFYLISSLAWPFLLGAKQQVERYESAASLLISKPSGATMACFHEASTLFEDLNTVLIYLRKCGKDHRLHVLWEDIRNHIRHAVREGLDEQNDRAKNERAERLGLDPQLQISIGFDKDAVKVGGKEVSISEIKDYLTWAENTLNEILSEGKKGGFIKSS